MKNFISTLLILYAIGFTATAQSQRLKVEGTIQTDTLSIKKLIISNGNSKEVILGNGNTATAGNGITIENGVISATSGGSVTKATLELDNVDNTSDASKPISTATQAALDAKADTAALALKATKAALNAGLAAKADTSALSLKADKTALSAALALKADAEALNAKADTSALSLKADKTELTAGLDTKANKIQNVLIVSDENNTINLTSNHDMIFVRGKNDTLFLPNAANNVGKKIEIIFRANGSNYIKVSGDNEIYLPQNIYPIQTLFANTSDPGIVYEGGLKLAGTITSAGYLSVLTGLGSGGYRTFHHLVFNCDGTAWYLSFFNNR